MKRTARALPFMILLAVSVLRTIPSLACTGFALCTDQGPIIARNTDLLFARAFLVRNNAGIEKESHTLSDEFRSVHWVSRYRSLTLNHIAVEFPNEGINEAGLVVAPFSLSGAEYPFQRTLPSLTEFEWMQYLLDTSASVDEAFSAVQRVNLVPLVAKVHFLVCDCNNCSIFEGAIDRFRRIDISELPAIANRRYSEARNMVENIFAGNPLFSLQGLSSWSSEARFHAAAMAARERASWTYDEASKYALQVLQNVAQGVYTRWHLLYEPQKTAVRIIPGGKREGHSFSVVDKDFLGPGAYELPATFDGIRDTDMRFSHSRSNLFCREFLESLGTDQQHIERLWQKLGSH